MRQKAEDEALVQQTIAALAKQENGREEKVRATDLIFANDALRLASSIFCTYLF